MNSVITEATVKRRDKLVIMAEIMDISKNRALKTQIMYRANLSFAQLNEYINFLTSMRLLNRTVNREKETYSATPKGLEFLKKQQEILGYLTEDVECITNHRVPSELIMTRNRKGEN